MLVWCDVHILISHWFFCDWFSGLTDVGYLSLGDHILLASTYSQLEGVLDVLEPSGQMVQLGIKRVESDQSDIQQMKKEGAIQHVSERLTFDMSPFGCADVFTICVFV